jgi:predicted MPP superfamily phosphohydrolase
MKYTTLIALILLSFSLRGQGNSKITIQGFAFIDKNNNGLHEDNEVGIPGVVISDQLVTVTTNKDGFYSFESENTTGYVFAVQPNNYIVKEAFWKSISRDQKRNYNFPMVAAPKASNFTFIHASDTHLSEQSLPRLLKLRAKVDSLKPAFMIVTGDLVRDALRVGENEATTLYEMYIREIGKFPVPVWNVPGNHEIFGIERHRSLVSEKHPLYGKKMYRHYLGPDYYSFSYGGVHFIGLNSVDYRDLFYYGNIDSLQLEWIKRDVSGIDKTMPIVTFNHIPFFSGGLSMMEYSDEEPGSSMISINGKKQFRHVVTNAPAVIEILKDHNYPVALGGHYHYEQKFTFETDGRKTEFHQTGAIVGPSSDGGFTMPSGFVLYTVTNGKITDRKFIKLN